MYELNALLDAQAIKYAHIQLYIYTSLMYAHTYTNSTGKFGLHNNCDGLLMHPTLWENCFVNIVANTNLNNSLNSTQQCNPKFTSILDTHVQALLHSGKEYDIHIHVLVSDVHSDLISDRWDAYCCCVILTSIIICMLSSTTCTGPTKLKWTNCRHTESTIANA